MNLLGSLDSSLRNLSGLVNLDNRLDDTDSDGLSHITYGETSKRGVLSESLDTHGLGRLHLYDSSVTGLDELGVLLNGFTGTAVDLLKQLSKLTSNVGGVAVQDRCVSVSDLTRVVHQDDLGVKRFGTLGRVIFGVTSNVTTTDFLDGDVLSIKVLVYDD